MSLRLALILLIPVLLVGCSPSEDLRLAEKEVGKFHDMFNVGAYDVLYVGTSQRFRDASSEKNFASILDEAHRRIGSVKSSDRKNWGVEANNTDGTLVTLTYHIVCENGYADEDFTYEIRHHQATLGQYKLHWHASAN